MKNIFGWMYVWFWGTIIKYQYPVMLGGMLAVEVFKRSLPYVVSILLIGFAGYSLGRMVI